MWLTWASQASQEGMGKEWHVDAEEKRLGPKVLLPPLLQSASFHESWEVLSRMAGAHKGGPSELLFAHR